MKTVKATKETIHMSPKEQSSQQETQDVTLFPSAGQKDPGDLSPSSDEETLMISLRPKGRPRHDVRESTKMDVDPRDVDEEPSVDPVEGALAILDHENVRGAS